MRRSHFFQQVNIFYIHALYTPLPTNVMSHYNNLVNIIEFIPIRLNSIFLIKMKLISLHGFVNIYL